MDIALKQRLVGATVLIALAVIVLPMLLGGRPEGVDPESRTIELPTQPPELDFETRRYPIGETPAPESGAPEPQAVRELPKPTPSPAAPPEIDTRPAAEPTAGEGQAQDAMEQEGAAVADIVSEKPETPPPAPPPAVEPPAPDTGSEGRYVVQVASFGAVDNASRLSETLRGYGYAVVTDTIKSDIGTLHRVRVGPYASEAEANDKVVNIRAQIDGVKPRVMDLEPDKVASMTAPSDPLVRWVVQVGSFASAANADNLVARLRLESLSAYKEEVRGSGSTIYRVRVGPFLEREEAIAADRKVSERLSLDGVVMSAD